MTGRATQPDDIRGTLGWTEGELRTASDTVCPRELADLVAAVFEGRMPDPPVVLAC